jgi:hypothetical protein
MWCKMIVIQTMLKVVHILLYISIHHRYDETLAIWLKTQYPSRIYSRRESRVAPIRPDFPNASIIECISGCIGAKYHEQIFKSWCITRIMISFFHTSLVTILSRHGKLSVFCLTTRNSLSVLSVFSVLSVHEKMIVSIVGSSIDWISCKTTIGESVVIVA